MGPNSQFPDHYFVTETVTKFSYTTTFIYFFKISVVSLFYKNMQESIGKHYLVPTRTVKLGITIFVGVEPIPLNVTTPVNSSAPD
jgi:hypothetical protein